MEQIAFLRDLNLLPLFLVLIPLIYLIFNQFLSSNSKGLNPPLPPGPKPWPIIGNILQIGTKPHISLAKFAQLHGPLISLKFGSRLVVVGSSPSAATEILMSHDHLLSARSAPDVISTPDLDRLSLFWIDCTDRWKSLRALCQTGLFSSRALESTTIVREKRVAELIDFLGTKEGQVVKLVDAVSTTVYNSLTSLLVSKDLCYFGDGVRSELKETMVRGQQIASTPNLADVFPVFSRFDLQGLKKKVLKVTEQLSATWGGIIEERRKNTVSNHAQEQHDFLDILLAKGLADEQISYLISELLSAGTDSVFTTVEWAMAELLKNKEAMDKACEELTREINQDFVTESHLSKLPYLLACVMETLRLYPPAPLLVPHRAVETCEVMSYTIPKDALVFVNAWAIGRDPTAWEDALSFKPERFLRSKMNFRGKYFEYLPFGSGRRMCPGYPLATKQVHLMLANLLRHFDWHLPNNEDPKELDMSGKFSITLRKEKPLCLIPRRKL